MTAEQGVGDQIMFASAIPDLLQRAKREGGSVILECEPRLVPLFARSFPAITVRAWDAETRGDATYTRYGWLKSAGGATCAIEMGSLPRYLRRRIESFPKPNTYLVPDAEEATRWRTTFAGGRAIGICWRSGKTGGHRAKQYAPLEKWADFIRDWEGTIVCAQYDASAEEIAELEKLSGRRIHRSAEDRPEERTGSHLRHAVGAGRRGQRARPLFRGWRPAAGVPTYKVLYDTSWTSFGTNFEPFAPACLCMMPDTVGDWDQVFAKTKTAVNARFSPA